MYHSALLGAYGQGGAMAVNATFVGDGSTLGYVQEQQQLTHEPGYSVGTGGVRGQRYVVAADSGPPTCHSSLYGVAPGRRLRQLAPMTAHEQPLQSSQSMILRTVSR